jgi:hypothetical protein
MIKHFYEVRPRKDKRGVDLISDALPFGRLRYGEPNAISNVKFRGPLTQCCDSRLRYSGQRDRNARASHAVLIVVQSETTADLFLQFRGEEVFCDRPRVFAGCPHGFSNFITSSDQVRVDKIVGAH